MADCKTRATIDDEAGFYLFPLPMTGKTPELLRKWALNPPVAPQPIYLDEITDEQGTPRLVGWGFEVERSMTADLHTWTERWLVTKSTAHVRRQRRALHARLDKAGDRLNRIRVKPDESASDFQARAEQVIEQYRLEGLLTIEVTETITKEVRRPTPPTRLWSSARCNCTSVAKEMRLAGWRIYVTNVRATRMSQEQAVAYYRHQWTAERGYHRFKGGSLPVLPIYLRTSARIKGLMILLMVALQALTLLEFVAQRELAKREESVAGRRQAIPKWKPSVPVPNASWRSSIICTSLSRKRPLRLPVTWWNP